MSAHDPRMVFQTISSSTRFGDASPRPYPSEAFDALKTAADILTDDDARAALDARLLDLPTDSLTLQELRWSREIAGLAEAEADGEVRGADAVLESARAYAAAEKALAVR